MEENKLVFVKKKGATKHCCHGTCNSDSRYADRPEMKDVFFIRFPQNHREPEKCARWALACSRQNFTAESIKKDTYMCCRHFVGGKGPTHDHPDPIPATATKYEASQSIIHVDDEKCTKSNENKQADSACSIDTSQLDMAHVLLSLNQEACDTTQASQHYRKRSYSEAFEATCDKETQTSSVNLTLKESLSLKLENYELKKQLRNTKKEVKGDEESKPFSIDEIKDDDEKMVFYTGLTYQQFMCLWRFLGPATRNLSRISNPRKHEVTPSKAKGPKRKLSPMNELFLTLVRTRLGLLNQDLAYRFNIAVSTVNDIVTTWTQFMYLQFNRLRDAMFASRKKIKKHLPKSFRKYKNVRVILDATEFFTQAPRNYEQQGNLYSSYKNHCTCKVLIGITPSGAISFVSDVYEGSISDKDIFKKSGILNKLNEGDLVMVDRGFNIRELLLKKGADIVIPPFLGDRSNLTPNEEAQTRVIAKLRIHVERVIERMKKFKILKKIVPLNTMPTFSQTVFVVACLVNFQKPIVK
ncbi:hypothetical protein FSP39_010620 [Pinctada imbricata]|uniref:THAP-type domain-containing protein n=1 Tax=Pinctada imbricata TaxID=66713 RepID=A0AA88YLF0_PINIB|nr:hypothetical protein FSP39_010620 [Pinctada imbricata]